MEQVHPERPAGRGEERPVGAEADVAIGVEVEPVEGLGSGGSGRVVGRAGELAGAAHHLLVAERIGRGTPFGGGAGGCCARAGGSEGHRGEGRGGDAGQQGCGG
jgi:hypothetical protein